MLDSRRNIFSEILREHGAEHALLTSAVSVQYLAGHVPAIDTGPSPFASLAAVLVCLQGEEPHLFLADTESPADVAAGTSYELFPAYTYDRPLRGLDELTLSLANRLRSLPRSTVAVEMSELPAFVFEALRSACPQLAFKNIASQLVASMRMIKDDDEIGAIRSALELCDIGQAAIKKAVCPEVTELDLLAETRRAMEFAAGTRLPLLADLVSGSRTGAVGGSPGTRHLKRGDLVLADLVPRHRGYWGDTCNTCAVGEATEQQRKTFDTVKDALADAIDQVRVGTLACNLDALLRQRIGRLGASYPHHSGHGIGLTYHEEPRIAPYNTAPLQAGMVITLEPGIYVEGQWGLRLEHTVLVRETGAEVLSRFQHEL